MAKIIVYCDEKDCQNYTKMEYKGQKINWKCDKHKDKEKNEKMSM